MMDEYFAVPIPPSNKRAMAQMDALLAREGIERDRNLTYSAAIYDDDGQMIATGSLFENTLRCLAVDGAHRGEGLMAVIVAHLVQAQIERGHTHLFLYTKVDSAKFFAPLGFTEIARVDGRLVFMENRRDGFSRYLKGLAPYAGERPGAALVMNANPFTLGHETMRAALRLRHGGAVRAQRGSLARAVFGSHGDGQGRMREIRQRFGRFLRQLHDFLRDVPLLLPKGCGRRHPHPRRAGRDALHPHCGRAESDAALRRRGAVLSHDEPV